MLRFVSLSLIAAHNIAGFIAGYAGYNVAFLTLAAIAATGLILFWTTVPETWLGNAELDAGRPEASEDFVQAAK